MSIASRWTVRAFALLAGILLLAAPPASQAGSPVLDRVVKAGVLKVGMTGEQPPFNAVSRSGPVIGYDVDLASTMASLMHVKLEVVKMPFGELADALHRGKVDMVISGMEITAERTRRMSFVGPYMMSGKSILSTAAVMEQLGGADGLNQASMRLVALEGSTSADFVKNNLPEAKLQTIASYDTGIEMLITGNADAMVADMPVCKLAVLRHPGSGLVTLKHPMSIAPVGIAIANNDPQFENLVRNFLDTIESVGIANDMRRKWFEESGWLVALP